MSADLTVYNLRPVLYFRPNWSEGVANGQLDDHSYDSVSGGTAVPWKPTTLPKRTLGLQFLFDDLDRLKSFRGFISERDGRRKPFFVPTWVTDYEVTADFTTADDEITIRPVGSHTKVAFSSQFSHLALITRDKMEFYEIEDAQLSGGLEYLTLDRDLDTALDASQTVCCGVMCARVADDEVEYEYISGETVKVGLKLVECPTEYTTEHEGSQPAYLYRLTRGSAVWRYTNWPVALEVESLTWNPADIEHDELTSDSEFGMDPVGLRMATDDSTTPMRALTSSGVIAQTDVEIFETDAHTLEADLTAPVYLGRLGEVKFGDRGVIDCQLSSILRIGEHEVPGPQQSRTCQHRLFDSRCGLSAAAFETVGTITVIGTNYIEATAFGAKATLEGDANWFALGKVTVGTEVRFCVGQSGNRLYLNAAFTSAVIVGNSATALPGCDKRIGTCEDKFSNTINFLGFPYMPNKNPQFEALKTPVPSGGKK